MVLLKNIHIKDRIRKGNTIKLEWVIQTSINYLKILRE